MGDVDITYILPSSSGSENTGNDAKGSKKGSGIIPQLQHCVLITVFLWQAKTSLNCKHITCKQTSWCDKEDYYYYLWARAIFCSWSNYLVLCSITQRCLFPPPFIDMKKSLLTCGACWTGEGLETEGCFNWDQMRTFLSR